MLVPSMSNGYMHIKNLPVHMKEQPKISSMTKRYCLYDVIFVLNDVIENVDILKIKFLIKDT